MGRYNYSQNPEEPIHWVLTRRVRSLRTRMQTATSETESKSRDLSICVHHYTLRAPCPKGQGTILRNSFVGWSMTLLEPMACKRREWATGCSCSIHSALPRFGPLTTPHTAPSRARLCTAALHVLSRQALEGSDSLATTRSSWPYTEGLREASG